MILAVTTFTEIILPLLNVLIPTIGVIIAAHITNGKTRKK